MSFKFIQIFEVTGQACVRQILLINIFSNGNTDIEKMWASRVESEKETFKHI